MALRLQEMSPSTARWVMVLNAVALRGKEEFVMSWLTAVNAASRSAKLLLFSLLRIVSWSFVCGVFFLGDPSGELPFERRPFLFVFDFPIINHVITSPENTPEDGFAMQLLFTWKPELLQKVKV